MNKLKSILHNLSKRSVCTILLAGLSQLGFAQQGENPWSTQLSLIDPWDKTSAVATDDSIPVLAVAGADTQLFTQDSAVYDNVGGKMVREVNVTHFSQGKRDAFKYYKSNAAGCTGFASGVGCFAFPGFIAVPTAVGLSTPKKLSNSQNPNNNRLAEIDYAKGYAAGAKKVRSRKAWRGFGIGVGMTGFIGLIALTAS